MGPLRGRILVPRVLGARCSVPGAWGFADFHCPGRPVPGAFGFRILFFVLLTLDFGLWTLDCGLWILDFGFWILDFGFRISDFGLWILGY